MHPVNTGFIASLDLDFAIPVLYINSAVEAGSGEDWLDRVEDRTREALDIADLIKNGLSVRPYLWHLVKIDVPLLGGQMGTDNFPLTNYDPDLCKTLRLQAGILDEYGIARKYIWSKSDSEDLLAALEELHYVNVQAQCEPES